MGWLLLMVVCPSGTDSYLAGAPDVRVRRIRRRGISLDGTLNKTLAAIEVGTNHHSTGRQAGRQA